jgi:hypothetical protein
MCADRAGCTVEVGFGRRPFLVYSARMDKPSWKTTSNQDASGCLLSLARARNPFSDGPKTGRDSLPSRSVWERLFPSQSGRLRGALASTLKSPAEVKYGCHWRVRSLPQFPTAVGLQAAPRIARLLPRTRRGRQPTVPGCRNQPTPHRGPTRSTWLHQG